jgi:hypothetical protein
MTTLTFDTLTYVKRLRAVGVPEEQAEIQAETMKELITEQLATKLDLKELETNLKRDMKEMELRLENKIADSRTETIKWVAAMLVAQAGLIAALVKLFPSP